MVNNQKSYATVVRQNSLPQPKTQQTFSFTAEQLTKFVANLVIQIAQQQICYSSPKQDTLDLKSSTCRKISDAAKTIPRVDITGKDLFESIRSHFDSNHFYEVNKFIEDNHWYFYPPEDPDDYRFDVGNEDELVKDVDPQSLIKLVTCKFLKRGKAPGLDTIHNEVLK